ncbi:MAG: hypothetical protein WAM14_12665 [Candidatus Nitrosopolaris sp.]
MKPLNGREGGGADAETDGSYKGRIEEVIVFKEALYSEFSTIAKL